MIAVLLLTALVATVPPGETTDETTAVDPNDLAAAHAHCIGDSIFAEWEFFKDPMIAPANREFWSELSDDEQTPSEFLRETLLIDTFNPDEATVTIEGAYQQDEGGEYTTPIGLLYGLLYDCLADELAMPERVQNHVTQTRVLDGLQEDSWGVYEARWSYHPDDGLSMTIWITDPDTLPLQTVPPETYDLDVIEPATTTMPPATTTPAATPPATTSPNPTSDGIYTVEQGDTMFGIAQKLGVELPVLLAANGLTENSLLVPGQQLVVPESGSQPSESLPSRSAQVAASCQAPDSEEADGTPIVFAPENVLDGNPETVWRCQAPATGERLTLTFDGETHLSSVGLIGGYVKVDPLTGVDRFVQNHRVRQVRWTFDNGTSVTQDLADSRNMQSIPVDATTTTATLEILATYPPGGEAPRDMVPVAEVQWTTAPRTTTTLERPEFTTTAGPECTFTDNEDFPLVRCDAGPPIAALQAVLQVLEYEIGTVDCLFGDQTHYAVQAFQIDEGLAPTGEIDGETWAALEDSFLPDWGLDTNGNGTIEPSEINLVCG